VSAAVFKRCQLYLETFAGKAVQYPVIGQKINDFVTFKSQNPLAQYGASDKPFQGKGNFGTVIQGLKHAHLTHDIMIVYTLGGRNPIEFRLYGVFSHDELGIGQPANAKRQKSQVKRMANQAFQ
jgi:mRNA-degrading endonuclease YafQ of YafQ-DinJ toxin-antitoxin module